MSQPKAFSSLLTGIADAGRELLNRRRTGKRSRLQDRAVVESCRELLTSTGEASGTALAREVVDAFARMGRDERLAFFAALKTAFAPDPDAIKDAITRYQGESSDDSLLALAASIEAPRQELFRRLNMAPGGTAALIRLRSELLDAMPGEPGLSVVDYDLRHLLSSWFNRGFLELRQIDWRTPAVVLEKIIAYEAVHEIRGWDDLRRRLEADRRCFGFFHPALPDEPLIFVEVALVNGIAPSVQPLIDRGSTPARPQDADTAIFYSISNCQSGLRGISFGHFLIKQVVAEIQRELPNIHTFSTLSPIPGFRRWLDATLESGETSEPRFASRSLRSVLEGNAWIDDPSLRDRIEPVLMSLCARYLVLAKRRDRPLDPVARFHLNNGAQLERINWMGDLSEHGLEQSAGMMVNYLYRPDDIISNHEAFSHRGKIIMSREVEALSRPPR